MAKKAADVASFLASLEHPRKAAIERLRRAILDADAGITEQVKWNAPSFCWRGDDRVTMRLQPGDRLELIFHRGAKAKEARGFSFADPTGWIVWAAKDRGQLVITDDKELRARLEALVALVLAWMRTTE